MLTIGKQRALRLEVICNFRLCLNIGHIIKCSTELKELNIYEQLRMSTHSLTPAKVQIGQMSRLNARCLYKPYTTTIYLVNIRF